MTQEQKHRAVLDTRESHLETGVACLYRPARPVRCSYGAMEHDDSRDAAGAALCRHRTRILRGAHRIGRMRDSNRPLMSDCITSLTLSTAIADRAAGNLPGKRLDVALFDRTIATLDQAQLHENAEIATQLKVLLDIASPN